MPSLRATNDPVGPFPSGSMIICTMLRTSRISLGVRSLTSAERVVTSAVAVVLRLVRT